MPDAKTIWLFREQLTEKGLIKALFGDFEWQLEEKGFKAQKGQIVDASLVSAPIRRNSRGENAPIKRGETPQRFEANSHVKRQKDVEARWTEKTGQKYYGYKDHLVIDNEHKLIRNFEVTSAEVHDSQVCFELLSENTSKEVWADSAYRSQVHRKGYRNRPLNKRAQQSNRRKSRTRARVEPVFGSMENEMGGLFIRVIGLARAKTKIGLMNLVYNLKRCASLCRRALSAA